MDRLRQNARQYGRAYLAAAGIACVVLVLLCFGLFERFERPTYDLRYRVRGEYPSTAPAKPGIVIVEITETTLDTWKTEPLAFWHRHYADTIRQAFAHGAKLVALDVIPELMIGEYLDTLQIPTDTRPDVPLLQAIDAAGDRLIFSSLLYEDPKSHDKKLVTPHKRLLLREGTESVSNVGFTNLTPEPDGFVRRSYLYSADNGGVVPGFAALISARALGVDAGNADALLGLPGSVERTRNEATFWINYQNRADYAGHAFPFIPMERFAEGKLEEDERQWLKDAIVLIGATHPGAKEEFIGAGARDYAGVEIQAHAIDTLLHHRAHGYGGMVWGLGIASVFAILALFILLCWPDKAWLITAVLAVIWGVVCLLMFRVSNILLPVTGPLAALALPGIVGFSAVRSTIESRMRAKLRPYVPLTESEIVADKGKRPVGGELRDISALFFDLRGSTAYAQFRNPNDVMNELNSLYAVVCPVIQKHGGTISTFMGDGFLAMFGQSAPALPNHAQSAVDAAVEILQQIASANQERAALGVRAWNAGCSVHSGPAVWGDLGVESHRARTAIGETINLASRLEGLNKRLNSILVVSRTTYERLSQRPDGMKFAEEKIDRREEATPVYYLPADTNESERLS